MPRHNTDLTVTRVPEVVMQHALQLAGNDPGRLRINPDQSATVLNESKDNRAPWNRW